MSTQIEPPNESMPERVICPTCKAHDIRSTVQYVIGSQSVSRKGAYWDEDGVWVPITTDVTEARSFRCSRGHNFRLASRNGGPWRDPDAPMVLAVPSPQENRSGE